MKHDHAPGTAPDQATETAAAPATVATGRAMLDALLASGRPPVPKVVEVLRASPDERVALIGRIHQTLGNGYVQEVIRAMTPTGAQTEIDRQLAIARKAERGPGLALEGSRQSNAYEVIQYGSLPIDSATVARAAIDKAHRRFARATQALDALDERLRDVLGVADAFAPDQIAAQIAAFHRDKEYAEAQEEYEAAIENLRATMAKFDADFDAGVAAGELEPAAAIKNHEALAYAGLDGAVAAYAWVGSKATIDPRTHRVIAVTAAPFQDQTGALNELLHTIAGAATREVSGDLHEAATRGQTPRTRFEAVWQALRGDLERLGQIESTIALGGVADRLREAIDSVKYFDAATGAPTAALAEAIEELALDMTNLGPIELRVVEDVTHTLKLCTFVTNVAVGDAGAILAGAKEAHEAAAGLRAILDGKPDPESVEQMEKLRAAAGEVERTGKALHVGLVGLGLAADAVGFLEDLEAIKHDGHDPFRYTALVGDLIGAMGDALLLLPPPGDAVGAAISLLGHGITAVSELLAAVWSAFEPPQVSKDRAKLYKDREAGTGDAQDDRTLASPYADANVQSLAQAGLAQPEILKLVDQFPALIQTPEAVYLLLWTRYTLLTSGVAMPERDDSGWRRYTLRAKSAFDFVWDAAHHFGGDVGMLADYVENKETRGWSHLIGLHWVGATALGEGEGAGIYGLDQYAIGPVHQIKNG